MLVLHPKSSCDVCLEPYVAGHGGVKSPQILVSCGHTFCRGCIETLPSTDCPSCRTEFTQDDIQRIHIDGIDSSIASEDISDDAYIASEVMRHQAEISRIVRQGAPSSELKRFLEECRKWLKNQPADAHDTLRVSFLLLYNFTEATRKLGSESQTLTDIKRKLADLNLQMATDKETNNRKYHELQESSRVSVQAAVKAEQDIREQHEEAIRNWAQQYEEMLTRCKTLEDEITELRSNPETSPNLDIENIKGVRLEDSKPVSANGKEAKGFHLSPLPVEIPQLASMHSFTPLEEEDDLDGELYEDDAGNTKPLVTPISIPSRARPPLSATALNFPNDAEWGSGSSPASVRSMQPLRPATSYSSMNSASEAQSARSINPHRQQSYSSYNNNVSATAALKDILDGSKGSPTDSLQSRGRAGSTASVSSQNARRMSSTTAQSQSAYYGNTSQPINIGQPNKRRTGSPHSFSSSTESRGRGNSNAQHPQRPSPMSSASDAARAMDRNTHRGPSQDRGRNSAGVRIPVS